MSKSTQRVPIGEVALFIKNGLSVQQTKDANGLPITRIETISNGVIDHSRVGYAGIKNGEKDDWLLQNGDILISHINSKEHLGKCAIYEGQPKQLIHGMNLLNLRLDTRKAYPFFILHLLRTPEFKRSIAKITKDSVNQSSFNISSFRELEIPLPYLEEQKRIAAILDKADAIRRKQQQAIKVADKFLRATFLDMFGDPVINSKGWDLRKLNDVGTLDRGVSKHRPRNAPELLGGLYPLIQTGEVANSNGYIRSFKSTYSEIGLKQSKIWPVGTLCITIAANIAKTGILTFNACFPDSIVGFTPNSLSTTEYIQYWFGFLQKILEDKAPESAQKNINLEILRNLNIPLPPIDLQKRFSNIVNNVQAIREKQVNGSDEASTLFSALTQRAFRGEL